VTVLVFPDALTLLLSLAALVLAVAANVHGRRAARLWRTAAEGWEARARIAEAELARRDRS